MLEDELFIADADRMHLALTRNEFIDKIYLAIQRNQLKQVLDLINSTPDFSAVINKADEETGFTLLHHAAKNGNVELIETLLDKGANPEARDKNNRTPADIGLFYAVAYNKTVEALDWLDSSIAIRSTAPSVNSKDSSGLTPLHAAVRNNNFILIKALHDKGANPFAFTKGGDTPVGIAFLKFGKAIKANDTNLALAWLNSPVFLDNKNKIMMSAPLRIACNNYNYVIAKAINEQFDPPLLGELKLSEEDQKKIQEEITKVEDKQKSLFEAFKKDDTSAAMDLLNQSIISFSTDPKTGKTLLEYATEHDNLRLLEEVNSMALGIKIKAGVKNNNVTSQNIFALLASRRSEMLAAQLNLPAVVIQLIGDYDNTRTAVLALTSEDKQKTKEMYQSITSLQFLELEVSEFKKDLQLAQQKFALTVPKIAKKLNEFLEKNDEICCKNIRFIVRPFYPIINELEKYINFDIQGTNYIKKYKEFIIKQLVDDFKWLYRHKKARAGLYISEQDDFISVNSIESLSPDKVLEKINIHINANPQSLTTSCWEMVCKYPYRKTQLATLLEKRNISSPSTGVLQLPFFQHQESTQNYPVNQTLPFSREGFYCNNS